MTIAIIALCVVCTVGPMVLVFIAIDRAQTRAMHGRLAERAVMSAQECKYGSRGYRQAMLIARAHAHKAGHDNGYRKEEWSELDRLP